MAVRGSGFGSGRGPSAPAVMQRESLVEGCFGLVCALALTASAAGIGCESRASAARSFGGVTLRSAPQQDGCRRFAGVVPLGKPLRILARLVSGSPSSRTEPLGRVRRGACGRGSCSRGFFLPEGSSRSREARPSGQTFHERSAACVVGLRSQACSSRGVRLRPSRCGFLLTGVAKSGRTECSAASKSRSTGLPSSESDLSFEARVGLRVGFCRGVARGVEPTRRVLEVSDFRVALREDLGWRTVEKLGRIHRLSSQRFQLSSPKVLPGLDTPRSFGFGLDRGLESGEEPHRGRCGADLRVWV